jgi:hypothetical protein
MAAVDVWETGVLAWEAKEVAEKVEMEYGSEGE